jgi:hypothetical protein
MPLGRDIWEEARYLADRNPFYSGRSCPRGPNSSQNG